MTRRPTSSRGPLEVRIMGIDPGSVVTGIGVIDAGGGSVRHVHHATIKVGGDAFPLRLRSIFERVTGAIEEFRPDEVAVEQVFVSRNASSALKLGQARGAAICAALAMHCEIAEYSARSVNQAISSGVARRWDSRRSRSPPSRLRPSSRKPVTTAWETDPTPAIAATPSIRHARNIRKPLSPPRSSRRARRSARNAPFACLPGFARSAVLTSSRPSRSVRPAPCRRPGFDRPPTGRGVRNGPPSPGRG